MENNKKIFFMTIYKPNELNSSTISLNNKNQNLFYLYKENIKGYSLYIDEIDINTYEKEINIDFIIEENKKNLKNENNDSNDSLVKENKNISKYKSVIQLGQIENDITFIFEYDIKKEESNLFVKFKDFLNIINEKLFNVKFTNSEKFLFYFDYLLRTKNNISENISFYLSLINDFIKLNDYFFLPIEIIISIFIVSYYEDTSFNSFLKLQLDKNNIYFENISYINLISSYNNLYLAEIHKCLEKLKTSQIKEKDDLLEIIIIYFIKFNRDHMNILFNDEKTKNMVIDIFKRESTTFIQEDILDKEIIQKLINNSRNIEDIINVLKNCNNYITYLENIHNNLDKIYEAINSSEALIDLKEDIKKFTIGCDISQLDDIDKFVELHNSIFKKQKEKRKFFIFFNKIIEKYFNLYKKYNNLSGICSLEIMINEEIRNFPNMESLKKLDKKLINEIKRIFFEKLEKRSILNNEEIISTLFKLNHHYNDKTFNIEEKKKIMKFFIEKCKNNDNDILKKYKEKGIYNLFSEEYEINTLITLLAKENFNINNDFLALLPQEIMDEKKYDILSQSILKAMENNRRESDFNTIEEPKLIYAGIFNRKDSEKFVGSFSSVYYHKKSYNDNYNENCKQKKK